MDNVKSIKEFAGEIKGEGTLSRFWPIIIILAASAASFGLGRLSAIDDADSEVLYVPAATLQAEVLKNTLSNDLKEAGVISQNGSFVASKNGTRYYFPWCSGVKQIKEENKVWFQTKEEAEKAGYTPAQNCKGL